MDIVEIENGLMQLYPDFAKNISQFPIGLAITQASRRSSTANDTDANKGYPMTGEPASQPAKR